MQERFPLTHVQPLELLEEDELEEGTQVSKEELQAVVLPEIQQVPTPFTQVTTSGGEHEQFGNPDEQRTPLEEELVVVHIN